MPKKINYIPIPGWKNKFWYGDDHTYWWDIKGKRHPLSGVTSVLGVINKPDLVPWAANLAAAEAYGYVPPSEFQTDLEEIIEKYGKLTGAAAKVLGKKHPEFESARLAFTRKTEKAASLGTDAHADVEKYIKQCINDTNGYPFEVDVFTHSSRVVEFADWALRQPNDFKFIDSESPLADPRLRIAGTPDFIAEQTIDGFQELIIGDLKTGSGIYDRVYFFQMAAYGYMWMKRHRRMANPKMVIIHMPAQNPNQPMAEYWSDDWAGDWECFKAALTLHRNKKNFIKPKFSNTPSS